MGRLSLFCVFLPYQALAQIIIQGQVLDMDDPVPYAAVGIVGTYSGVGCDGNGRFKIEIPDTHQITLHVSCLGFNDTAIHLAAPFPLILKVFLSRKPLESGREVIVSAHRTARRRLDSTVPVNVLDRRSLEWVHAQNLSQGLNYLPGLRVETDCQTCNYSQLRINGLSGSHSRILLNSRPLLSDIAGLYVMEQFPAYLIERIEVIRGGGSVLFGAGAIAGTVNIITRKAQPGDWGAGADYNVLPQGGSSLQLHGFSALGIKKSKLRGMIAGSLKQQEAWDANKDGYSEIPRMKGGTLAMAGDLHISEKSNAEARMFYIGEYRRGGDRLDVAAIEATQSEERIQHLLAGDMALNHRFSQHLSNTTYLSAQQTLRTHYTGIDQADGYGSTYNHTIHGGSQLTWDGKWLPIGNQLYVLGTELQHDRINDQIPAYGYRINQNNATSGAFVQGEWEVYRIITVLSGLRLQYHSQMARPVLLPRLSAMFRLHKTTQLRMGYGAGFRPPQAFDTDLHIAFAGGGVSTVVMDPSLKPEKSESVNVSLDYQNAQAHWIYGFTIHPFFTKLRQTFVLAEKESAWGENRRFEKRNGSGAGVWGISVEARLNYRRKFESDIGFTMQESEYEIPVRWTLDARPTRRFLRTPRDYGFVSVRVNFKRMWQFGINGVYTGKMDVLHLAGSPQQLLDEVKVSPAFADISVKISKTWGIKKGPSRWRFYIGVGNLFNSYQRDFDTTRYRDSNYIYGPSRPRNFYAGIYLGIFE